MRLTILNNMSRQDDHRTLLNKDSNTKINKSEEEGAGSTVTPTQSGLGAARHFA